MSQLAKRLSPDERKALVSALRVYHEDVFKALGSPQAYYYPKVVLLRNGSKVITFFPSELNKETDVYTEFIDFDYTPLDPKRPLYRFKYNPYFAQELATEGNGEQIRYVVPIEEMEKVHLTSKDVAENSLGNLTDEGFERITIRDIYAIVQNKPASKKNWLNEMIKSNQ
ncbi:MAG TPA: hypothetical protein VGM30_10375 [Puia sp.]|jgi:hypothetical protein